MKEQSEMTRQSKVTRAILMCAQKVAEREVLSSMSYRPAACGAIFHQPKRPKDSDIADV